MLLFVEELLLGQDLDRLARVLPSVEPPGNLLSIFCTVEGVHEDLNLVSEIPSMLLNAAHRISKLIPVSISINAMGFDPCALDIVEDGVELVRSLGVLEVRVRTIYPYDC